MNPLDRKRRKIVVCDDESQLVDFLQKVLSGAGYEVLTASNGNVGLALIKKENPDLIILDLIMPGLSGLALLDILNARGSTIPVLVTSTTASIVDDLAHQGIAGLLIKPIDVDRLLAHVQSIFLLEEESLRTFAEAEVEVPPAPEAIPAPLPDTPAPPQEAPPPPQEPPPALQARRSSTASLLIGDRQPLILIVEDEPDMQTILGKLLEYHGATILIAGDGVEGLDLARQRMPDAIILDIMLPRMDGFQVCRLLKFNERYRKIPIVILTARAAPADRELAEASGADAFLAKPFEAEQLIRTLQKALRI